MNKNYTHIKKQFLEQYNDLCQKFSQKVQEEFKMNEIQDFNSELLSKTCHESLGAYKDVQTRMNTLQQSFLQKIQFDLKKGIQPISDKKLAKRFTEESEQLVMTYFQKLEKGKKQLLEIIQNFSNNHFK